MHAPHKAIQACKAETSLKSFLNRIAMETTGGTHPNQSSRMVAWFIYWLNQYAVRKDLEPRQKELQILLRNLNEPGEI